MSLVIPVDYASASIELRNENDPDPWFVTFGVDLSDVGGDYVAAGVAIAQTFADTIGLQLSTRTKTMGCNLVVGQDGPDHLIVNAALPTPAPGTSTGAMLPQNCAALYDKVTARAGRRGRGRFFMPSILQEGDVSDVGVLQGTTQADLQLQATAFLDGLADIGPGPATPMVLLHNAGVGTVLVTTPDPVTALRVQNTISTQRRRLR
jgi:hypothetical protein